MHTFTSCEVWYVFHSYGPVFEILSENFHRQVRNGPRSVAVVWGTALQAGRLRVRFLTVSLKFFIDNRNEYLQYFLGVKVAGA
jgi:hypothetical protein